MRSRPAARSDLARPFASGEQRPHERRYPTPLSDPCFYEVISLLLRSMRCSQYAKDFAARTDSGTSDCLQAIDCPSGGTGTRSSRHRAPLNSKVGSNCLYVCPLSIRAVCTSTSGAVWDQILRGLEFPFEGRQTDRQTSFEFPLQNP